MLREPVSHQHKRIARISRAVRIWIIRALPRFGGRIRLLIVQRILNWRFQRLIVRWEWTIFQAARNVEPTHAILMQSEWTRSAQSLHALAVAQIAGRIRSQILGEIGRVISSPLALRRIPPDKPLA